MKYTDKKKAKKIFVAVICILIAGLMIIGTIGPMLASK